MADIVTMIIGFAITNLLVVISMTDSIFIGQYTILDYTLFLGYLGTTLNFIKRMINKRQDNNV